MLNGGWWREEGAAASSVYCPAGVAAGRVRTEKVEAERVLVATVTAQLHCGAAAVKKKVSQRRACLVRIEARGRDLSLCASPPYANIDPSGSTLKLRSAAQLSSKCWTFPAPLVCCFAHAGFLDARRGASRDSKSAFRSNMLKFCPSLSASSPAATYPSLLLATLPLVRNTEHSHEGSTHLLLDAEDISEGKIDASGYKYKYMTVILVEKVARKAPWCMAAKRSTSCSGSSSCRLRRHRQPSS